MKRKSKSSIGQRPTLKQIEALLGPAAEWAGRCYEIAKACVAAGLVDGVAVYGHFIGKVHPRSYFGHRVGVGFVRHGWVKMRDGSIFDPTSWAFTTEKPFLYFGPDDPNVYDEGGNRLRGHSYAPRFNAKEKRIIFTPKLLPDKAWAHVERLLGVSLATERAGKSAALCLSQCFWLANLPYDTLQPHARTIYLAFEKAGRGALVPIDNYRRAEREGLEH